MKQLHISPFVRDLQHISGWAALNSDKRNLLQEKTSNIKRYASAEGLAAVSGGIELLEIENMLNGERMTITSYVQTVFGASERTAWRKLSYVKQLVKQGWPIAVIKAVAERGALLLRGSAGIGMKDLVNVAKELPAPKDQDAKTIDGFIENEVRTVLREHKATRQTGNVVRMSDEDGAKKLFNDGRRIMRGIEDLKTSADRRALLKTVVGWWMEDQKISGSMTFKANPIPEGTFAKVGRPSKKSKEKI